MGNPSAPSRPTSTVQFFTPCLQEGGYEGIRSFCFQEGKRVVGVAHSLIRSFVRSLLSSVLPVFLRSPV